MSELFEIVQNPSTFRGRPAAPGPVVNSGSISSVGVTPRSTLESVAQPAEATQLQTAGDREILPIIYGRTRVGAKIATAIDYQGDLLILCVWGYGPVEAIDQVYIGNDPAPAAVTITTYLGSSSQTFDTTLAAAFTAKGLSYADNLPYVAYSVVRVPPNVVDGFPQVSARVKGRKVFDWRDVTQNYLDPTTYKWSDNPVLCLWDALANSTYGAGLTAGISGANEAANDCDIVLGSKKKRTLNICIDKQSDMKTWVAALRTYAACWVRDDGAGGLLFTPDIVGSTLKGYNANTIVAGSLKLRKRSNRNAPNVVEVIYTDTTIIPYRDGFARSPQFGTGQERLSQIRLPGIDNYEQAYREAVERVNDLNLNDLEGEFISFDDGFYSEEGDIVSITHPIGLAAKLVRVTKASAVEPGRFRIAFKEYDPAKYSTDVVAGPSYVDTNLPTASFVNPPTSLVLTEELFQLEAYGSYASRIKATWVSPSYPLIDHYHIDVLDNLGNLIWTADPTSNTTTFRTGPVKENIQYTINVYTVSAFATRSAVLTGNLTAQGKLLAPGDVPAIRAFEAGGKVFISWDAAVDIDIARYELRYASTNSWAAGILIDRPDSLTFVAQAIPPGTWYIMVKAIDSVGTYSANAVSKQVTVTLDNNAYLINSNTFVSPTTTSMTQWTERVEAPTGTSSAANPYYTSDFGDGFGFGHDNTNNATGIFGDSIANVPWCSPHSTGSSTSTAQFVTEVWDAGLPLAGTWIATIGLTDHVGAASIYIETSTSASTGPFTTGTGTSIQANARWVRMRVLGTGAFTVRGNPSIQVSVVPRREVGTSTTVSTTFVRVTLQNRYVFARSVQVTPVGTGARFAVVDNIIVGTGVTNTFDIYAFNDAGAQVAIPVYYTFEGVN